MMGLIYLIRNAASIAFLSLCLCILSVAADIEPPSSGETPAEPGAEPTEPGAEPAEPGAEPAEPGAEPAEPGAEPDTPPDPDAWREQAKQSLVEVRISIHSWFFGRKEKRISGIAVGEHLVLTDATFVRDGGKITITYPTNPQSLTAEVHSIHDTHPVALLRVNGLAQPTAVFSHEGSGSEPGHEIASFGFWEEIPIDAQEAQGYVGSLPEGTQPRASDYFSHSAVTGYGGYGGGVFNECGQLVGLNVAARAGHALDMKDVHAPTGAMHALHSTILVDFLRQESVVASSVSTECLTTQERLEQELEEAQRQKEAELDEARLQKEAELEEVRLQKEAELEEVRLQKEEVRLQKEAELEEVRLQKEAELEELRLQKEAELEELRLQIEEVLRQKEELRLQKEEMRLQKEAEIQAEKQAALKKMYLLIGVSAGLLLLLFFAFLQHRRKKKRELAKAQQQVEQIQADAQRRFSDCLLQGHNQEGQEINIKLSGKALAQEGVLLGRSLEHSDGVIDDSSVSRKHARLYVADDTLLIEDLHSMNGTIVNDRKVRAGEAEPVRSGDTVRIGAVDLRIIFR